MNKYTLQIEDDAKFDISDAFDYYSNISENLAPCFLSHLTEELEYLKYNPKAFQKVYHNYHQMPLRKFKFVVLYKIEDNSVKIYRVFHTSRDPKLRF